MHFGRQDLFNFIPKRNVMLDIWSLDYNLGRVSWTENFSIQLVYLVPPLYKSCEKRKEKFIQMTFFSFNLFRTFASDKWPSVENRAWCPRAQRQQQMPCFWLSQRQVSAWSKVWKGWVLIVCYTLFGNITPGQCFFFINLPPDWWICLLEFRVTITIGRCFFFLCNSLE